MLSTYLTATGHPLPGLVTPDGKVRLLGRNPTPAATKARLPRLASAHPVLPRSQWQPFSRVRAEVPILDQGQHGSCVGHGSTTALMYARAKAGMPFQYLSSCFLYGLVNGGRDAGANIADALAAMQQTGVALLSEVPEGVIYRSQFPPQAFNDAARFKVLLGYSLATWDEVVTAALLGFDLSLSVHVGGRFNDLDANGVPPAQAGTGNHCVYMGCELLQSGGEWLLGGVNSWSEEWGERGHFRIAEAHVANQAYFDGFAIQTVLTDPQGPDAVPVAA